jgi:hypothetical protein
MLLLKMSELYFTEYVDILYTNCRSYLTHVMQTVERLQSGSPLEQTALK